MTVLAVVAYGVYLFLGGGLPARAPLKVAALGIAVVIASAVVGKGLGLIYARLRLLGLVAALRRRLGCRGRRSGIGRVGALECVHLLQPLRGHRSGK